MRKISIFIGICLFSSVLSLYAEETAKLKWQPLFNGKNLDGWKIVSELEKEKSKQSAKDKNKNEDKDKNIVKDKNNVTKAGQKKKLDVRFEGGLVVIESITGMDGLKYTREFPKCDYEICYEARRTEGSDFFAAITFPVGKDFCTFINGGWGGSTIGLSCVDGSSASDNETFDMYTFNDNEWYKFRIRVTKNKIEVWITGKDGEEKSEEKQVVNLDYKDKKISLRDETDPYKPLGFASWYGTGNLRKVVFRNISNNSPDHK
jgi:hypothetical protein